MLRPSTLWALQWSDTDQSLQYLMHLRYYASSMGRFLKPNPINGKPANQQSWNLYAYVRNNPVNFNDPTGLYTNQPNTMKQEKLPPPGGTAWEMTMIEKHTMLAIAKSVEGGVGGDAEGEKGRIDMFLENPKGKSYLIVYGGDDPTLPAIVPETGQIITYEPIEEAANALADKLIEKGAREIDLMPVEADFVSRWNSIPAGRYDSAFYIGHTADNGSCLYGRDKSYIPLDSISLMKSGPIKAGGCFYWIGCSTTHLMSVSNMLQRGTLYGSATRVEFPFLVAPDSHTAFLPRSNCWAWKEVP